jgi:hypothetical protein
MLIRFSLSWIVMITGLTTISLMLGTAIAYSASSYAKHQAVIETLGGLLLLGGLALMGYTLEAVVGQPLP